MKTKQTHKTLEPLENRQLLACCLEGPTILTSLVDFLQLPGAVLNPPDLPQIWADDLNEAPILDGKTRSDVQELVRIGGMLMVVSGIVTAVNMLPTVLAKNSEVLENQESQPQRNQPAIWF